MSGTSISHGLRRQKNALYLALSLATLVVAGCSGRQVEVRTGTEPVAETAIHLTNNLSQAVNVYVVSGGNDIFVKQVAANSVGTFQSPAFHPALR